nr:hypothetical protein [Actinomycetota bacterium]
MALETTLLPRGPYSLELSARRASDATRLYRDGYLTVVFEAGGAPVLARVWQWRDAQIGLRVETCGDETEALD